MRFASDISPAKLAGGMVLASMLIILLVLGFILARRVMRERYFRKRDARAVAIRADWKRILSGEVPAASWFADRLSRAIIEEVALEGLDSASAEEAAPLDMFLHSSGLLAFRLQAAEDGRGWRRREAIQVLGRMRSLAALPVCARALDDPRLEVALDAVRALGLVATPEAGSAIVARLSRPHTLPAGIVESALLSCYRGDAPALLHVTLDSGNGLRRILARVLAEAAGPELTEDFTSLASDGDADVRASAARILAAVQPAGSARLLCELARDKVWFVRLRAMLALGVLRDPYTLPVLIEGLCDRNRLVRLRAASALGAMDGLEHRVLGLVEKTGDRYALQALVGALDRAGKLRRIVDSVTEEGTLVEASLLAIVRGGALRTVTEAAHVHPQEAVRRRLNEILRDAAPAAPALARKPSRQRKACCRHEHFSRARRLALVRILLRRESDLRHPPGGIDSRHP
jgi:hypothetical protein